MAIQAKNILKSIQQGLLICDEQGRIVFFNQAYADFAGCRLEDVKGQPIASMRPGSIVRKVLKSGQRREHVLRQEAGQTYYVNVYPIWEGHTITGTVSLVTTVVEDAPLKMDQLTLKQRVRLFEKQQIEDLLAFYGHDLDGKRRAARELGISMATLYNKLGF